MPFATDRCPHCHRIMNHQFVFSTVLAETGMVHKFGDVSLDFGRLICTKAKGKVHLTGQEWRIIALIVAGNGAVISRDDFIVLAWGYDVGSRSLDTFVANIRKKIGLIDTVHGFGYKLKMPAPVVVNQGMKRRTR